MSTTRNPLLEKELDMTTKKKPIKRAAVKACKKTSPKKPAKTSSAGSQVAGTLRLPKIGEKLTRTYHGKECVVEIVENGFRYQGHEYTSLTALAKEITGYKAISGPAFFGLWKRAEVE
ncbi:MAG: DUF2924 domain-containing protein [bacterium]|nr:DUF2924 domain-containing protein [bacterium]